MANGKGLSAIELLTTLAIASILLSIAPPAFTAINKVRLHTSCRTFYNSLNYARAEAVYRNKRIAMIYNKRRWEDGWIIFTDSNANGKYDPSEQVLYRHAALNSAVKIYTGKTVGNYIAYLPNGYSVHANNAFLADTISFCPTDRSLTGYTLVINRAGRVRTEQLAAGQSPCTH